MYTRKIFKLGTRNNNSTFNIMPDFHFNQHMQKSTFRIFTAIEAENQQYLSLETATVIP